MQLKTDVIEQIHAGVLLLQDLFPYVFGIRLGIIIWNSRRIQVRSPGVKQI